MSKETNQVEDIFREAFENYEVDPGSNAWQAIQTKMAAEGAAASSSAASTTVAASSTSWVATAIVATVISATAIGGYFFFNDTAEKIKGKTQHTETKEQIKPTESINDQTDNLDKKVAIDPKSNQADVTTKSEVNTTSNESIAQKKQVSKQKDDSKSIADNKINNNTAPITSNKTLEGNEEASEVENISDNRSADLNEELASSTNPIEKPVKQDKKQHTTKESDTSEKGTSISNEKIPSETAKKEDIKAPEFNIPNVFSPNQDGINDEFIIEVDQYDKIEVRIFNKSNRLVFETNKVNDHWSGDMQNGSAATEGLYFYQIVVEKDGKTFPKTGSVSLTR